MVVMMPQWMPRGLSDPAVRRRQLAFMDAALDVYHSSAGATAQTVLPLLAEALRAAGLTITDHHQPQLRQIAGAIARHELPMDVVRALAE